MIPLTYYGIRLDSGDLALSFQTCAEDAGRGRIPDAVISASNDLDEYLIDSLKTRGAAITSWGVGTNLITSKDCPSFGGVYKLAAIMDADGQFIPKIKLSENTEKITNPETKPSIGSMRKTAVKSKADLICLVDEKPGPGKSRFCYFDPHAPGKRLRLAPGTYTLREIMLPVFRGGTCIYETPKTMDIREYCQKSWIPSGMKQGALSILIGSMWICLKKLYDMKIDLLNRMSRQEGMTEIPSHPLHLPAQKCRSGKDQLFSTSPILLLLSSSNRITAPITSFAENHTHRLMYIFSVIFVKNLNKAPFPFGSQKGFSFIQFFFQIPADGYPRHFIAARGCNKLISVGNDSRMSGYLCQTFRILLCKCIHLSDRRIFFKIISPSLSVKNLQRVTFLIRSVRLISFRYHNPSRGHLFYEQFPLLSYSSSSIVCIILSKLVVLLFVNEGFYTYYIFLKNT